MRTARHPHHPYREPPASRSGPPAARHDREDLVVHATLLGLGGLPALSSLIAGSSWGWLQWVALALGLLGARGIVRAAVRGRG